MKNILLIDDDKNINTMMKMIFEKSKDHKLTYFDGPLEAIEYLEKNDPPDLIFLDMMLPHMSGIQALDKIMAMNRDIKVIMLTGVDKASSATEAMKKGASDYMVKPIDAKTIRRKVEEHIGA